MIAKLIVWDESREKALKRMSKALSEYQIHGVTTNIDFLSKLVACKPFVTADLDTGFIDKHHAEIFKENDYDLKHDVSLAALFLVLQRDQHASDRASTLDPYSPWNLSNGWRLNEANVQSFDIVCHEQTFTVELELIANQQLDYLIRFDDHELKATGQLVSSQLNSSIDGYRSTASVASYEGVYQVFTAGSSFQFNELTPDLGNSNERSDGPGLNAPMNGTIVTLLVEAGAGVAKDDTLLVMEAMKMEHTIRAPAAGVVQEFYFQVGSLVDGGAELLAFEANE
jgi:3-methylcrotonyl-CoA carboxylase alpha subunit